jgi:hypothetical protein
MPLKVLLKNCDNENTVNYDDFIHSRIIPKLIMPSSMNAIIWVGKIF